MAIDEGLAQRLDDYFDGRIDVEKKKMFGGLCYMLAEHMCCGVLDDTLMVRIGKLNYADFLKEPHVLPMDFTGKPLTGFLYVKPEAIAEDEELHKWIQRCEQFVSTLPPKTI